MTVIAYAPGQARGIVYPAIPVVPALMPGVAWRSNANSVTGTADGATLNIPVVTGGTNLTPTAGTATYVASAVNSKPGVRLGSGVFEIPRAGNAAFYTGMEAQNWTMYVAFTNSTAQEVLNCFLQLNDDLVAVRTNRSDTKDAGVGASPGNCVAAVADSGTHVLGIQSRTASVTGQAAPGRTIVTLDGLPFGSYVGAIPRPGNKAGGGSVYLGGFQANMIYNSLVTLLDLVVYNANHTLAEMWDNTKALRYVYGLSMPTKIALFDGSSLKGAVGADAAAYGPACETMRQCSLPFGSVGTAAIGGLTFAGMTEKGSEVDGLLSRVGAANCYLIPGEGYNDLLTNSAATSVANFVTYLNARVAAGWLPGNILLDTITGMDAGTAQAPKLPAYASGVKAIPGANPGLSAVRIINTAGNYSDNDAQIGIGQQGLVTDGIHLSGKKNYPTVNSGYPRQADTVYKAPVVALGLG